MAPRFRTLAVTFAFVFLLALALAAVTYVASWMFMLFVAAPLLLAAIYLLPGHGEPDKVLDLACPRCGRTGVEVSAAGRWSCAACGARGGPRSG